MNDMAKRKIRPMDEIRETEAAGTEAERLERLRSGKGARKITLPPPAEEYEERPSYEPYQPGEPEVPRTNNLKIAGILLIVTALLCLIPAFELLTIEQDIVMDSYLEEADPPTIFGRVTTENLTAIENAEVRILGTGLNTTTDFDGLFEITEVPPGKHIIIVSKDGFNSIEHKIYLDGLIMGVMGKEEVELDFELTPGSGVETSGNYESEAFKTLESGLRGCGVAYIIAFVIILVGAVFSIKRKKFAIVILACIFGILFGLGAFYIGTILSIAAIVLVYKARKEFSK
jgi:hypothetical protein